MTPSWVAAILHSRMFLFVARLLLVTTYVVPGVMQAAQFQATMGDFAHFNLMPPAAYVTASIITLLAGSILVILGGKWTWLGAGALGVYTGLTILIVHHFWTMQGAEWLSEMRQTLEHISLIGGLMVVAILERAPAAEPAALGAAAAEAA
jgi:transmembrane protein